MISKTDKKILQLLQNNARMPISQIAKEVNMSENGVKYRMESLEKKGIVKRYTVLVDPKTVGKQITAIFNIELEPRDIEKHIHSMVKIREFITIFQTTGEFSVIAIGLFDSHENLTEFINNKFLSCLDWFEIIFNKISSLIWSQASLN